ncbi:MAG: chemotaxis protein CheW [Deltaproteobacteria bacterium]|nr:chemotaxis protein CheW [Deltaproteobacteria bacterium]
MTTSRPASGEQQMARFTVGTGTYAIDIMQVREVLSPLTLTEVPGAPKFIEGLAELRGEFLPVIDLRRRMGLPMGKDYKVVVATVRGRRVGLVVDQVIDVFRVRSERIAPLDTLASSAAFSGVIKGEDGAIMIIEPDGLVSDLEAGALGELATAPE